MREIKTDAVTRAVRDLFISANQELGEDIVRKFESCANQESSATAAGVLKELRENARIAREESAPLCQDTGLAILFIDIGRICTMRRPPQGSPSTMVPQSNQREPEKTDAPLPRPTLATTPPRSTITI